MKRLLMFDSYASPFQIAQETIVALRAMPGVLAIEVLAAVAGQPEFCLIVDTDDSLDAEIGSRLEDGLKEYDSYITNISHRAFRKVG